MIVHFVCDEASSLGQLPQIDGAIDKFRGYGIRLQLYYQSLAQLRKCFPDGQDQNLLANVSTVFFSVNGYQEAEYISNRLGEQTIVVGSGGTSRGTSRQHNDQGMNGNYGTSSNANDNWQLQARRLLKPEEVMALSPRTAITFTPGVRPIATQLVRYYEEQANSLRQRVAQGIRATGWAIVLLVAAVIAAKTITTSYQYRLEHTPARAVHEWQF